MKLVYSETRDINTQYVSVYALMPDDALGRRLLKPVVVVEKGIISGGERHDKEYHYHYQNGQQYTPIVIRSAITILDTELAKVEMELC